MMTLLLAMLPLTATALAEPPVDAPLLLPLELPEAGVVRVPLPPDVVGRDPARLGGTLRLYDAAGAEVPFTVAVSEPVPMVAEAVDTVPLGEGRWRIGASERPVESLSVMVEDLEAAGPVHVRVEGEGEALLAYASVDGEPVLLDTVPVAMGRGPWILSLRGEHGPARIRSAEALSVAPETVAEICRVYEAGSPTTTEEGTSRYAVDLGGPRHVETVRVDSPESLFDRSIRITTPGESRYNYGSSGRIRRIDLAGTAVDRNVVSGLALEADALMIDISDENGRALLVTSFRVCSTGAELLARDVGTGPHTLYVGSAMRPESDDLAQAKVELLRAAVVRAVSTAPVPNPAYRSLADREGVAEPAAILPLVRWRWARPISGEGWLRIPLDRTVLAHARSDLGDVRVVDAEDREVPVLVRRTGRETAWEIAPFSREERGSLSRIRVELGADAAPVATVKLTTTRGVFQRRVTVLRDRGTMTEPLRSFAWHSGDEQGPGAAPVLAIAVDEVVGGELLIEIDNGPNPPLAIESVTVTFPEWELRGKVPAGSRVVYGAPGATRPAYDLRLLESEVLDQPAAAASLGEEAVIGGPTLSGMEKTGMFATVAVLALGLFAMTARVLVGKAAA